MIGLSRLVLRFLIPSITVVLLGVAVHAGQGAQANPSEEVLARLFDTAAAEGQARVIVGLNLPNGFTVEGHLPNEQAVTNQRNAVARTRGDLLFGLFGLGAEVYASWDQVPYVAMKVAEPALEHLVNSPLVTTIHEDSLSFPSLASATTHIGSDVTAASGYRGAGQTVVIFDTGIDTDHPFFGGRVVWQECFSAGGTGTTLCPNGMSSQSGPGAADVTDGFGAPIAACDDGAGNQICDHGVHVAGIAAGEDDPANALGPFDGVAPDANIIPIQVFSRFTGGDCSPGASPCVKSSQSDQISAFVAVTALSAVWDISSVNMSLGGGENPGTCDGNPLKLLIDVLRAINIATVIAAGNDGWTDAMGAPGCISTAVTVGSVFDASTATPDGVLHNMDAGVDLLAVGSGVISSVPDDTYGSKGGTSMATPQVTGAFAVIASIDPSLTVDEIEDLLKATGVLVTDMRSPSGFPGQNPAPISGYVTPRLQLDAAVAALVGEADLRVLKDCKPDLPVLAGTTVTCTIFVDNLGPAPALNVVAVDEYLSNGTFDFDSISTTAGGCSNTANPQNGAGTITCDLGNMAAGERVTIAVELTADEPQDINDVVTVSSDVADPDASNNDAADTVTFFADADLRVLKLCKPDGDLLAGDTGTCTIIVDNLGPATAENVVLTDTHVSNESFDIDGVTGTGCGISGGVVTCNLGDMAAGASETVVIEIDEDEAMDINDIATVASDTTDPDASNNDASDGLHIVGLADLNLLNKTDNPDPVVAGEQLTYTIDVRNDGPSTAINVVVSDNLPAGVTIDSVSAAGGGSCKAGVPGVPALPTICNFDSLGDGDTETMTIIVTVLPQTTGLLQNDASVSSDTLDSNNANDNATETTTVATEADLRVTKSASPDPEDVAPDVIAGTSIIYTVGVTNDGPSTARDVSLVDTLPAGTAFVSADILEGAGACDQTMTDEITCSAGDLDPGQMLVVVLTVSVDPSLDPGTTLTNTATASSDTMDPDSGNDTATTDTDVQTRADLWMEKTGNQPTGNPSGTIRYFLTAHNDEGCTGEDPLNCGTGGPSDARDLVVVDTLPENPKKVSVEFISEACDYDGGTHTVTCVEAVLPVGESVVFEIQISVKGRLDVLVNAVEVSSSTTDPDPSNNDHELEMVVKGGTGDPGGPGGGRGRGPK